MSDRPKRYLSVEQPDQEATVEFLSFHPIKGVKVEGVTVKMSLSFDERTSEAKLYVYAINAADAKILIDASYPVTAEEIK